MQSHAITIARRIHPVPASVSRLFLALMLGLALALAQAVAVKAQNAPQVSQASPRRSARPS